MTTELAIKLIGTDKPHVAASMLKHFTAECPLRYKVAARLIASANHAPKE